jgi:alkanesulfonate monooxygenase SsuD/methylene tetrahydromethanopterin reductase-like flavin-dependent oxidoreductase (luciferase family)
MKRSRYMPPTRTIGIDIKHEGREYGLTSLDYMALAEQAERAEFESFWTNEDIGFDSLGLMSAASQRTQRIKLGTAIVNCYTRSAFQLAMAAATLDELSGGRAVLGISTGHHPWNDLGHGMPIEAPVARLREYVQFLKKALAGDPFTHDGRFFPGVDTQLDFEPVRRSIPIHIAAARPQMTRLAGEVADGIILNVVTADYIRKTILDRFYSAARDAGRDLDDLEVTALVTCCVSDNRDDAIDQARQTFTYRIRRNLGMLDILPPEHHEETRYLHNLIQEGKREQAEREASEALVTMIMNAGSPDDVWAGLQRYFDAGCTRVLAVAYPRARADIERMISALGPKLQHTPSLPGRGLG